MGGHISHADLETQNYFLKQHVEKLSVQQQLLRAKVLETQREQLDNEAMVLPPTEMSVQSVVGTNSMGYIEEEVGEYHDEELQIQELQLQVPQLQVPQLQVPQQQMVPQSLGAMGGMMKGNELWDQRELRVVWEELGAVEKERDMLLARQGFPAECMYSHMKYENDLLKANTMLLQKQIQLLEGRLSTCDLASAASWELRYHQLSVKQQALEQERMRDWRTVCKMGTTLKYMRSNIGQYLDQLNALRAEKNMPPISIEGVAPLPPMPVIHYPLLPSIHVDKELVCIESPVTPPFPEMQSHAPTVGSRGAADGGALRKDGLIRVKQKTIEEETMKNSQIVEYDNHSPCGHENKPLKISKLFGARPPAINTTNNSGLSLNVSSKSKEAQDNTIPTFNNKCLEEPVSSKKKQTQHKFFKKFSKRQTNASAPITISSSHVVGVRNDEASQLQVSQVSVDMKKRAN